jgi:4-amino-4-deoxy-L-arabinose transferase-like glycosyltransferase
MSTRRFVVSILLILTVATTLRTLWLRADPPTGAASVGVVWHDEGVWVASARNKALWGVWRTDNWNPVFIAPVFTAFEYVAFRAWGVGTWQARMVPVLSGLTALVFLILGLHANSGRRAAVVGGWLLATNYVFVMWNRAALMESTMTAWIVVAWAAYAMAERRPRWGFLAGLAVVLAWFTKESAAFFLAAMLIDGATTLALARDGSNESRLRTRAVWFAFAGLAVGGVLAVAFFVAPHWREFTFYNWTMTVERKPSYSLRDLRMRASWLPLAQDVFTRMWIVVGAAALAICGIAARWRRARPAERLLVLWIFVGLLELVVHESGNERRYVMFIPAFIALAAILAGASRPLFSSDVATRSIGRRVLAIPLLLALGYLVFGSLLRPLFSGDATLYPLNPYHRIAWASAGTAAAFTAFVLWQWARLVGLFSRRQMPVALVTAVVAISLAWNLIEYGTWARARVDTNYQASRTVEHLLPEGTLVQGKLANGLSLENRIRPVFVGDHFGNYEDRFDRDDVRDILTYVSPYTGYESGANRGALIRDILRHYPDYRTIIEFPVNETGGPDRAALIDKFPDRPRARD